MTCASGCTKHRVPIRGVLALACVIALTTPARRRWYIYNYPRQAIGRNLQSLISNPNLKLGATLMRNSVRGLLLFVSVVVSVTAGSNQFVARYLQVGAAGSTDLLAVDASGNFFIVGTVQEPSGLPQIRAIKTDPQGNAIASFDFGGGSDFPSGAVVDPQGNLVIVGTTYSQDFPLVSPLISTTTGQAGFVVQLDAQLTKIVFSTPPTRSPWIRLETFMSSAALHRPIFPLHPGRFRRLDLRPQVSAFPSTPSPRRFLPMAVASSIRHSLDRRAQPAMAAVPVSARSAVPVRPRFQWTARVHS